MYFVINFPNLMDIPDILVISMDLLYKPDIPNIYGVFPYHMGFLNIYGTYMVFIVIIAVNPELDCISSIS